MLYGVLLQGRYLHQQELPVTANPSSTSSYTVTGTDANGCTNTTSVSVTVNHPAFRFRVLPVSPSLCEWTICFSYCKRCDLAALIPGPLQQDYLCNNRNFCRQLIHHQQLSYTVTGTDANGCTNTNKCFGDG